MLALVVLGQGGDHRGLGLLLRDGIESGVDAEAAVEDQVEAILGAPPQISGIVQELLLDFFYEIALGGQRDLVDLLGQRLEVVGVGLLLSDIAQLDQSVQHNAPLAQCPYRIVDGIVAAGIADECGEKSRLPPSKIGRVEPPVHLGRGLDPVGALAEIHGVQIQIEDVVLLHLTLQTLGHRHLLELSLGLHLVAHHQVLDQLLGDGGAALGDAPCSHVL